jgi:hypothetical protein
MALRIYIDTSVIGGVCDDEFREASRMFFDAVDRDEIIIVVSDLLQVELAQAPPEVRTYLNRFAESQIENLQLTEEAVILADRYLTERVVGATSRIDYQHIAIATIERVDVLVSWNFKHIVNLRRIRGYNSVNLKNGYPNLEIRTPEEVLE